MQTKTFPNDAFQAVALDSPPVNLPRYGHAKPGMGLASVASQYLKALVSGNHCLLEDSGECFFSGQTATPLKSHAGSAPGATRYRESSALGYPGFRSGRGLRLTTACAPWRGGQQ